MKIIVKSKMSTGVSEWKRVIEKAAVFQVSVCDARGCDDDPETGLFWLSLEKVRIPITIDRVGRTEQFLLMSLFVFDSDRELAAQISLWDKMAAHAAREGLAIHEQYFRPSWLLGHKSISRPKVTV